MRRIFSIVILFSVFFFGNCSIKRTTDVIWLIPEGYEGIVMIVYDQKNGSKEKYQSGKRVYEIPNLGIVMSQFESDVIILKEEVYYLKSDGSQEKIDYLTRENSKDLRFTADTTKIYYYLRQGLGKARTFDIEGNLMGTSANSDWFIIGKFKDLKKHYAKHSDFLHYKKQNSDNILAQ